MITAMYTEIMPNLNQCLTKTHSYFDSRAVTKPDKSTVLLMFFENAVRDKQHHVQMRQNY